MQNRRSQSLLAQGLFAGKRVSVPDEGLPEAVDPLAASLPAEAVPSCAQSYKDMITCETHSNAAYKAKEK